MSQNARFACVWFAPQYFLGLMAGLPVLFFALCLWRPLCKSLRIWKAPQPSSGLVALGSCAQGARSQANNLFFLLPLVLYLQSGYLYWTGLSEWPRLRTFLFLDTETNTFRRQQYHRDGQAGPWTVFSLRPEDDFQEGSREKTHA